MTIIDSVEEFDLACARNEIPALAAVPDNVIKEFRERLHFASGGLSHAVYSMLEIHVPANRIPELFAHFGITAEKFAKIRDTFCGAGTGKCFSMPGAFCDPAKCKENGP